MKNQNTTDKINDRELVEVLMAISATSKRIANTIFSAQANGNQLRGDANEMRILSHHLRACGLTLVKISGMLTFLK